MLKLINNVLYVLLALVQAVVMPVYVAYMATWIVAVGVGMLCMMPFVGIGVAIEYGKRILRRK
jgi:hypothetical protein